MARSRSSASKSIRERAEEAVAKKEPESPDANHDGACLTVSFGEEQFNPMKFHTFKVPGPTITVNVPPGMSIEKAAEAAEQILERIGQKMFERKLERFIERHAHMVGRMGGKAD